MEKGIILGNNILDVVFVAWFIAQFYKVISGLIVDKKLIIKRFWETGGMPSSHSSTVSALTTSVGIVYGTATPLFAISIIFSIIVLYDAAGIRRAAGKQARVLNQLGVTLNKFFNERLNEEKLKELLGHTPVEVLIGTIVGVAVAFIFKFHLVP
ncbi:MAG: divergent PAP2 family protein [Bacteroidetes bacterium]|nr:MAG: divergent PAP2 family protein [Bacteroidota bacterium]